MLRAADFWRPPAELHTTPDSILGPGCRRAPRSSRKGQQRETPDHRGIGDDAQGGQQGQQASGPGAPARPPRRARTQPSGSTSALGVADSCAADPARVGRCRTLLPDGRVAAVPLSPRVVSRELEDEGHELLVTEMQAAPGAGDEAWLEDESVAVVVARGGDGLRILLPRASFRAYVMRLVPLSRPTKNLSRSLYKMCAPEGPSGPILTLVPVRDVLFLAEAQSSSDPAT